MKAIYGNKLYAVNRLSEFGVQLLSLEARVGDEIFYVGRDIPGLIINPTQEQIEAASGRKY